LPMAEYLKRRSFLDEPSVFHWRRSDGFIKAVAGVGILLSLVALSGLADGGSVARSAGTWLVLWFLYLSFVNVGQTFYGFGWESMLVEAGFFAAFLGPSSSAPSFIPILILRWMLFRTELGA